MKTVVTSAILWLALAAAGNAQNINVTSPTTGNEWCLGSTCTITWTKSGTMPAMVAVRLRRAGAPDSERTVANIATNTANDGSLSWTIPDSVPAGDYFIRIRTSSPEVVGDSANFKIKSCTRLLNRNLINREILLNILTGPGQISGRISGDRQSYLIRDHKVRVVLKKGGGLVKADNYTLDAQGSCNYLFFNLLLGTYEVTVEKAATTPSPALNPCFNGTTPAIHTAVLTTAATNASGQDFFIKYALAWGTYTDCW